ncbi:filamentous hemagglutinin N-terminal domain-containing protein [Erwinia sp. S43]|uniref:two-partner secretion domain-containing protein n=1 Tax=unclassified Erwinia TaxID=2622719 RepID=UPI00190E5A61|nr:MULTISPECIES: filamentous hemagglutinin N-terminal domain-containing protein [unclassified Erwinia]MBK0032468.1 filamentous hemagglutinin N-terminal domain-containing protein [Erwinia sp. S43]MCW1873609.1 filamentous hemagglutinin N-terminal domain-containing protein [Erwinia sp. INIA01]
MLSIKINHQSNTDSKISKLFKVAPICLMTWAIFGGIFSAEGAVIADSGMVNRPGIHENLTGPTIVDINDPSKNGVSHNKFTEFNVNKNGLVLNNNTSESRTILGGKIAGNSNLSNGPATVIINEVASKNMTQLNGMIEVAGKKANVIVASPSGISCDGCGFINTERGVLTTGKVDISNNPSMSVSEGNIILQGNGLQDQSDYTALIAHTINIIAEENSANNLTLMAGKNADINHVDGVLKSHAAENEQVDYVGIDVAKLGGMYADKITLIAGQKGVSIKNRGIISADTDLVIQNNGTIRNTGSISSGNDMTIYADTINNRKGSLTAGGNFMSSSQRLENISGSILADGKLNILADANINNYHGAITAESVDIKSASIQNIKNSKRGSSDSDKKSQIIAKNGDVIIVTNGEMSIGNGGTKITASKGSVSLKAGNRLGINSTEINAKDVVINAAFANSPIVNGLDGTVIKADQDVNINLNSLFAITSDSAIKAGNDINLNIANQDENARNLNNLGTFSAGNNFNYKSSGAFSNFGTTEAGKVMNIHSAGFNNYAKISGNQVNINSTSGFYNKDNGQILSKTNIVLSSKGFFRNTGGITSINGTKVMSNFYRNDGKIEGKVEVQPYK